ncbi:uncharacterized protein LOC111079755 [Drosophila obscura]|uniref:uncharacterized protein LOC111079755 n=1 Tax=Drosophila obscura TaxID=7282 RepID=UPI000BA156F4|nr:uncharacterized protein LOC111079755 [Drosophila obscura]
MEKFGAPRGKRPRVQVSMEQKERAIARILSGETKAGISRELGVPESTVRGWVKRSELRSAREKDEKPNPDLTASPPQSWKLPQKRNINGHPVAVSPSSVEVARKYMRESLSMAMQAPVRMPIPIPRHIAVALAPLPLPFPMPQSVLSGINESVDGSQLIYWLHIFNAGILNFTWIVTAALQHARDRGYAHRLSLWQIINKYVDEAARNVYTNAGVFAHPLPKTYPLRIGNFSQTPRLHITAEDDEEDD